MKRAAAAAGRRSPNTKAVAWGAPPRSRSSARSAAMPSSSAPASAVPHTAISMWRSTRCAGADTSAARSVQTNSANCDSTFTDGSFRARVRGSVRKGRYHRRDREEAHDDHRQRTRRDRRRARRSGAHARCAHARDPAGRHHAPARLRARRPAERERVPPAGDVHRAAGPDDRRVAQRGDGRRRLARRVGAGVPAQQRCRGQRHDGQPDGPVLARRRAAHPVGRLDRALADRGRSGVRDGVGARPRRVGRCQAPKSTCGTRRPRASTRTRIRCRPT